MKFAVVENEFGEVGVDEKVLSENVEEEVIEVMNGCICCTVRGDLVEALKKLYKRVESFDGVIIETTGLPLLYRPSSLTMMSRPNIKSTV
jgi:G3E family GTPase